MAAFLYKRCGDRIAARDHKTPCVPNRRYNKTPICIRVISWWLLPDLNWGHKALQASALPTELKSRAVKTRTGVLYDNAAVFTSCLLEAESVVGGGVV